MVDLRTGTTKHFIQVHKVAAALGPEVCRSLLLFHSLAGSDKVCKIFGIGKKKAWQLWQVYNKITATFVNLASAPQSVELGVSTSEDV